MITTFDLESFGKQAAANYVSDGVEMNASILKLADDHNLNLQQIHRVVESANVDTYLQMIKTSEDKYVDFPLADAKMVYTKLTKTADTSATSSSNDYESAPVKTAEVSLFPGIEATLEKTATMTTPYAEIKKEASRIEGLCRYIANESERLRYEFQEDYDKVWDFTKQAILQGENVTNIFEIIKVASPTYADYIIEDFTEFIDETMPKIDIQKEATYKGIINPKSGLYKLGENLEYLGDRFNKVAGAFVTFTEKYEDLRKQASVLGGLKKLIVGGGETAFGATKNIGKAISKNPKLILAGLVGTALYGMGKSKGRRQQGDILQQRALPAKYRNITY